MVGGDDENNPALEAGLTAVSCFVNPLATRRMRLIQMCFD